MVSAYKPESALEEMKHYIFWDFQIELDCSILTLPCRLGLAASLQRGKPPHLHNECPRYYTKQSDGEAPVMLELCENVKYLSIAIAPWSTLARSGSTW